MILDGPRLVLRPMTEADAAEFAALNADPEVMRHFVKPLSFDESEAFRDRIARQFASQGFGFRGVFRRETPGLIGMVGLTRVPFAARVTPSHEISWRIARAQQRRCYAEEAARLCLAAGFGPLQLPEIVAWTLPANEPSWRQMRKLGMRDDGLFEEPRIPEGHPKRVQRLFRLTRAEWVASRLG
jgi:ribosomal-protein-alanine N-acetyltransferase